MSTHDSRPSPVLTVVGPPLDSDDLPVIHYEVYAKSILLRTDSELRRNVHLQVPQDVADLVARVYQEALPLDPRTAFAPRLQAALASELAEAQTIESKAVNAVICTPDGDDNITEGRLDLQEDDERPGSQIAARTRLESIPSITLSIWYPGERVPKDLTSRHQMIDVAMRCVRVRAQGSRLEQLLALPTVPGWSSSAQYRKVRIVHCEDLGVLAGLDALYDCTMGFRWLRNGERLDE